VSSRSDAPPRGSRVAPAALRRTPEGFAPGDATLSLVDLPGGAPEKLSAAAVRDARPRGAAIPPANGPAPELAAVLRGATVFAADVLPEGLLHGAMLRPPRLGARLASARAGAASALPGFVAFVGENGWAGVIAERPGVLAGALAAAEARWDGRRAEPGGAAQCGGMSRNLHRNPAGRVMIASQRRGPGCRNANRRGPLAVSLQSHGGDRAGGAVPEGGRHLVHVHQALDGLVRKRQRLACGIAHTLPGSDGMASQRLDQKGEGQAARHVGVEVLGRGSHRAKATGGAGLGGGHHGVGDGADFHADAARQVEPIRLDREVEGEHRILHFRSRGRDVRGTKR
jgi:hypothetical protein